MEGTDKNSNTRSTCVGDAPAHRMEADRRRLPAGTAPLPMCGWLFQVLTCPHEMHRCSTARKVPTTFVSMVHGDRHLAQAAKSSISAEQNTKNLASFKVPFLSVYLLLCRKE